MSDHAGVMKSVQENALAYFVTLAARGHDLTPGRDSDAAPISIAAVGFALAVYPIAIDHGGLSRKEGAGLTLAGLRRMAQIPQGPGDGMGGTHGLFYHFLNRSTGIRTWRSEVSAVDTALFLAGALFAATYSDSPEPVELEIRTIADGLYRAADWTWPLNDAGIIMHGWKPECGFLHYGWTGYNEAILLYLLALGSPTHPIDPSSYQRWTSPYQWERIYGYDLVYAGPLFTHLFSNAWIDFREIRDRFMREKDCDYAENTRRAIQVQREYAIRNPCGHVDYGPYCWGLSAGPGPGDLRGSTLTAAPGSRPTFGYAARGVPHGPDDGTISPVAVAAALPYAPEAVAQTIAHLIDQDCRILGPLGLSSGFNASVCDRDGNAWLSTESFGIDQGAAALMIENHLTGFPWATLRRCPYIREGLRRAGFSGGWLERGARS